MRAHLLTLLLLALPAAAHAQTDTWPHVRVAVGGQWSGGVDALDGAFAAEAGPRVLVALDGRRDGAILHVAPSAGCLVVAGQARQYTATVGATLLLGGTTWGVGGRLHAMLGEVRGALGGGGELLARVEGYGLSLEVGGGVVANDAGAWGTLRFGAGLDVPHLIGSFLTTFRQSWADFRGLI